MIHKSVIIENDFIRITKALYKSNYHMESHFHSETAISYILNGRFNETVEGQRKQLGSNTLLIKPSELNHNNLYFNDCFIICLYLKTELNLPLSLDRLVNKWGNVRSFNFLPLISGLVNCNSQSEVKNSVKQILNQFKYQKEIEEAFQPPQWLVEVKNILEKSHQESLTTQELAFNFKKHPVYIARAFKRYFGVTIKEYLHRQRANSATTEMAFTDNNLSQIAYSNGYADQSHLNRKMKEITGLTPLQLKNILY